MPSKQDKTALLTWVERLPKEEKVTGYRAVLQTCAERYGNTTDDLDALIEQMVQTYQASLLAVVREHRKTLHPHEIPDPDFLKEAQVKCMRAVLLRMWTYSSEYFQRWTLPKLSDMTLTDEEIQRQLFDGES